MLARAPAVRREKALADAEWLVLERCAQGVVPAIEEAEGRDDSDDLDDLRLAKVAAHRGEHLVGHAVRHRSRGDREIECHAFGLAEERARAELPHRGELLLLDAEVQRAAR